MTHATQSTRRSKVDETVPWSDLTTELLKRWQSKFRQEVMRLNDDITEAQSWGEDMLVEDLQQRLFKVEAKLAEIDSELVNREAQETSEAEGGAPLH